MEKKELVAKLLAARLALPPAKMRASPPDELIADIQKLVPMPLVDVSSSESIITKPPLPSL